MKYLRIFAVILFTISFIVSCKPAKKKVLTPANFLKIENEVLSSDLTPASKETIAKKFGYTLKQYNDFEEALEKDPDLKTKVGEVRLNMQKDNKGVE